MDKSEASVEVVGDGGSTLGTTGIGGNDHTVLSLVVLANVAEERRLRIQVVDGNAEEAFSFLVFVSAYSISSSWAPFNRSVQEIG